MILDAAELANYSSDDLRRGFLVMPHDVEVGAAALPEGSGALSLVTNWWVERCLHAKRLVDPADFVLCRPFDKLSISGGQYFSQGGVAKHADVSGFDRLTVNSTGFTGIELLHVTKAVALFGKKTSIHPVGTASV